MSLAAVTDALIVGCWVGLVADNGWMALRERPVRDGDQRAASPAVRLGVLGLLVFGVALLERRTGGRLGFHVLGSVAGVGCAVAGLLLHMWARRALGVRWSSAVAAPPGQQVVTSGPYAFVRHPIYLGVLLLAAGTLVAHPSVATACVAAGLATGAMRKIAAEERVLRTACGQAWRRYAAAVPMLLPRPSALIKRAWR